MNPRAQECLGHFGYGNGYLAPEGKAGEFSAAGYCGVCRLKTPCWEQMKESVPEARQVFEDMGVEAALRGTTISRIAVEKAEAGNPDPYIRRMLDNMQRGLDERYKEAPPRAPGAAR